MKALTRVGRRPARALSTLVLLLALQIGLANAFEGGAYLSIGAAVIAIIAAIWTGWGDLIRKLFGEEPESQSTEKDRVHESTFLRGDRLN